jgi:hypothetical protein
MRTDDETGNSPNSAQNEIRLNGCLQFKVVENSSIVLSQ